MFAEDFIVTRCFTIVFTFYCNLQPLPEKHSLTIDRFDKEFVKFREVALHRFMGRIAAHPVTSSDQLLKAFLTLESNVSLFF